MAPPNRLFVFDCDGTLVDSQHNIVAIMRLAFAQCGLPEPAAHDIRRQVGLTLDIAIAHLLEAEQAPKQAEVTNRYRAIAREWRSNGKISEPLFPGIKALIEALGAPRHFLAVATGKNMVGLEHTLAIHGLRDHFHSLQTADRCPSKPNPDMVLRAMDETACQPEDTIVIGDTTFDMEMALSAGAMAVGVAWGYHDPSDLTRVGAHHVISNPSDLLALLARS